MSEIRHRLEAHRNDVLILLDEAAQTARFHEGFRLAGAISHLARAQALFAEELDGLPAASEERGASSQGEPAMAGEDATPVDGIHRKKKGSRGEA